MDRWTYVKVIPSNQTLILASERGMSGGPLTTALARALKSAAAGSVLTRVTIVTARPDDTLLYLDADYSSTAKSLTDAEPSVGAAAANDRATLTGLPAPIAPQASRASGPSSANRGIALYASTERLLAEGPTTRIDVHA